MKKLKYQRYLSMKTSNRCWGLSSKTKMQSWIYCHFSFNKNVITRDEKKHDVNSDNQVD